MAIFGFIFINNFSEATEKLDGKLINYVNIIAGIVHESVENYQGKVNKSLGDAFLIVWKFPEDSLKWGKNDISLY